MLWILGILFLVGLIYFIGAAIQLFFIVRYRNKYLK